MVQVQVCTETVKSLFLLSTPTHTHIHTHTHTYTHTTHTHTHTHQSDEITAPARSCVISVTAVDSCNVQQYIKPLYCILQYPSLYFLKYVHMSAAVYFTSGQNENCRQRIREVRLQLATGEFKTG